ncbi:MAG: hypothetical protein HP496_14535, partial [Nitrospira sp.]|nr:hypothetical protein [Nitrospira sp.]
MGEPLRARSPADRHAEPLTETNGSKESSCPRPALVSVPSQDARAQPIGGRTYKRRLIGFVHPLQARVLSHVMAYSLVVFVMLAIPVFKPLMQSLDNPALSWQEHAAVANDLLSLHTRFWPWALGASLVVLIHCVHSLLLMQRVAGPLYRLARVFPQIGDGNLCIRATFREGDYLVPEADLVNQMTAQLQTKINMLKHAQVMLALDTARFKELAIMKNDPALTALAKQMEQN